MVYICKYVYISELVFGNRIMSSTPYGRSRRPRSLYSCTFPSFTHAHEWRRMYQVIDFTTGKRKKKPTHLSLSFFLQLGSGNIINCIHSLCFTSFKG